MSAPRILQVVPHPGGGGETYIRLLEGMGNVRFESLPLTRHGRPHETPAGLLRVARAIPDYDLVHIHGDAAGLVCLPVIGRRPTLITLNGLHLFRRARGGRGWAVRTGLRRAFERADTVIAVSERELEDARELAPEARVELIYNGVPDHDAPADAGRRATRERLRLEPASVVAVFAGELTERKQPLEFARAIEAARRDHPELVGLVLGEGPLRKQLEPLQGSGLRLLGHRSDYAELVAAADVVVLPSLWEGLAYAALDGMALGRAMLVSDGPGNPDAVGEAGLIFPAGDVPAMADGLSRLAADPELRASLGEAAARRARERFTLSGMRERTARVYERALDGEGDR